MNRGYKGYKGRILTVDLGTGEIKKEKIPDEVYEKYLSGMGLGAYILYNRIPAGADPLGPDNMLGFVSGLLTGTGTLFTGRWMAVGKSPLTGTWGDANCGGNFSPAIKKCGFDAIFFKGISEKPVYLSIIGDIVEIKDASHVWGMDAIETDKALVKESGMKRARVACIGPAGEKLSLISGISNDKGRMAARSGLGAVMGSKRLKAVVLAGSEKIHAKDRDRIKRQRVKTLVWVNTQPMFLSGPLNKYLGQIMRLLPVQMALDGMIYKMMLKRWGTVSMNQMSIEVGDSPIKNWKGSNIDFGAKKSNNINPNAFTDREIRKYSCYSCPLGCGGVCSVRSRKYGDLKRTHKPEYETVLALSGLLLNSDLKSVFYLNELFNRAGMDTISAGNSIAFAIECYEKGILKLDDTDGIELEWGNTDAIVALAEKMVEREGIGDILADGAKAAADKIGKGALRYAMHAGGQDLPLHDGRNDPGYAIHYSVEASPGKHTIGALMYYDMYQLWKKVSKLPKAKLFFFKKSKYRADKESAIKAAACSKFMNVANGAGLCMFGAFMGVHRLPIFEWLNAATGWANTPDEYMEAGERIQTLKQAFNIKHGIDPKSLKACDRSVGQPPLLSGANKGLIVEIDKMMKNYWEVMGWNPETGEPDMESIQEEKV